MDSWQRTFAVKTQNLSLVWILFQKQGRPGDVWGRLTCSKFSADLLWMPLEWWGAGKRDVGKGQIRVPLLTTVGGILFLFLNFWSRVFSWKMALIFVLLSSQGCSEAQTRCGKAYVLWKAEASHIFAEHLTRGVCANGCQIQGTSTVRGRGRLPQDVTIKETGET